MSDTKTSDSKRPDILRDEDPPGEWKHHTVGGKIITWALWPPYTINEFNDIREEWVVELVLKQQGDYGDEDRPVDIWVVDYPPDHIVDNYRDGAIEIGQGKDMEKAAEIAVDFMFENPGHDRQLNTGSSR